MECAMLYVLVALAVAYMLYIWGVRLQLRARLTGKLWLDLCSYACMLSAGTAAVLTMTLNELSRVWANASIWELSLVSTLFSILFGEYLHARSSRLSLQLLTPLRSNEGER
jgi:hypothetical protein